MTDAMRCPACDGTVGVAVDSYKHTWWTCRRCRTTRRRRRSSYPVASLIPHGVARRVAPTKVVKMFYPEQDVISDERHRYDLYDAASALDLSTTKWAAQIESVTARLREHGASFEGREVLDVSGGPGFMTAHFAANGARRAVVTEFSPEAVAGMRRNLGVEAVTFDYQTDRLRDVVDGTFDLVVIDYSINFCLDVTAFVRSLKEVLRPGGFVYISWVHPTLGCFMKWQFDEYTYNALYRPETVDAAFYDLGFKTRARMSDAPYDYRTGWSVGKRILAAPFVLWYRARAPRGRVPFDRSLEQRSSVRIYEWPRPLAPP